MQHERIAVPAPSPGIRNRLRARGEVDNEKATSLWVVAAVVVVLWSHALLLLSVNMPPLVDLPNHLARLHIHFNVATDPLLARAYEAYWKFQPNLALDAFGAVVGGWLNAYQTGTTFAWLAAASILLGTAALNRAIFGALNPIALLSAFLVVNRLYRWGFLGYVFSIGVALGGIAAWIGLRNRPRLQWGVGTLFGIALYLAHLYAFGIYAASVAALEAVAVARGHSSVRAAGVRLAHMVPAVLIYALLSPHGGESAIKWDFASKIAAPAVLLPGYDYGIEIAILGALGALVLTGLARGHIVVSSTLAFPIAVLSGLFLVMPTQLMTSWSADRRLLIPIALMTLASMAWRPHAASRRATVAAASVLALFAMMHVHIALQWQKADRALDEVRALAGHVPPGASVASMVLMRGSEFMPVLPLYEAAALLVIERSVFVPSLFAFPRDAGQSIRYADAVATMAGRKDLLLRAGSAASAAAISQQVARLHARGFQYLLVMDSGANLNAEILGLQFPLAATPMGHAMLFRLSTG